MFENIPLSRLMLYVILAGLLPFIFVAFHFMTKLDGLENLESAVAQVQQAAFLKENKQAVNNAVRHYYRNADHFYIDKYLETLTFLEPEIESLQKIVGNSNYPENESIKKRLEFLTGSANHMIFTEGVVQSTPFFQEVTETLVHPVEVTIPDLKNVLSKVEGVEIGPYSPGPNRPQLIILDFKIDKKSISEINEVFLLNMKLLKREFL